MHPGLIITGEHESTRGIWGFLLSGVAVKGCSGDCVHGATNENRPRTFRLKRAVCGPEVSAGCLQALARALGCCTAFCARNGRSRFESAADESLVCRGSFQRARRELHTRRATPPQHLSPPDANPSPPTLKQRTHPPHPPHPPHLPPNPRPDESQLPSRSPLIRRRAAVAVNSAARCRIELVGVLHMLSSLSTGGTVRTRTTTLEVALSANLQAIQPSDLECFRYPSETCGAGGCCISHERPQVIVRSNVGRACRFRSGENCRTRPESVWERWGGRSRLTSFRSDFRSVPQKGFVAGPCGAFSVRGVRTRFTSAGSAPTGRTAIRAWERA